MSITSSVAPFEVVRTGPRFGAEITGIDLTAPIDDTTADALRQAFLDHKVPSSRCPTRWRPNSAVTCSGRICRPRTTTSPSPSRSSWHP
ncbi:hypothetical protein [Streptomyces sp. NPDC049813]|uniref:hypothetical protein n=1 Tax=Streptomyces sp. NPDC049813 TaxID=3365597 RepID=UPI0037B70D0D